MWFVSELFAVGFMDFYVISSNSSWSLLSDAIMCHTKETTGIHLGPGNVPLTLDLYLIMLSVKQGIIK